MGSRSGGVLMNEDEGLIGDQELPGNITGSEPHEKNSQPPAEASSGPGYSGKPERETDGQPVTEPEHGTGGGPEEKPGTEHGTDEGSVGKPVAGHGHGAGKHGGGKHGFGGHGNMTEGVKTLLGEPKQAIIKLAIPMILAMTVQTVYNVVDAFWVSGLGTDALASVGFFFPFYMMSMAIGMGLGVGGGSAISRKIGLQDKEGADKIASHTMVTMFIITILYTGFFLIFIERIFLAMDSGDITDEAVLYARIMFSGSVVIFFINVGNVILRSEGDAKRAMMAIILGSGLNIILDPIFIYTLDLGVAGAAYATVLSISISALFMFNWLFLRKDTFVTFHFRGFRFDKVVLKDIFRVGLPAFIQFVAMSVTMLVMNFIIVQVDSTDGIAVFSTGWRVIMITFTPVFGIGSAVTAVAGAAYGARDYRKVDVCYMYAIKIGIKIMIPAAVFMYLIAPYISLVFTQADDGELIRDDLTLFLQISCLMYPAIALGPVSSSMFQGTGKGTAALTVTLIRTVILTPPIVLLCVYGLDLDLAGVFWGITIANLLGTVLAYGWAKHYIKGLICSIDPEKDGCEEFGVVPPSP